MTKWSTKHSLKERISPADFPVLNEDDILLRNDKVVACFGQTIIKHYVQSTAVLWDVSVYGVHESQLLPHLKLGQRLSNILGFSFFSFFCVFRG